MLVTEGAGGVVLVIEGVGGGGCVNHRRDLFPFHHRVL